MTADAPGTAAPRRGWERLEQRPDPWASDAFAAGGGLLALSGVVSIGIYAGIGAGFAGTWGWLLTGVAVVVAYLAETRVERPLAVACTAVIAAGVPAAMVFLQWPIRDYGTVRAIEALSIGLWLAVFLVGGTRGRAVFLGLALFVAWGFAVGEAGDLEHNLRLLQPSTFVPRLITPVPQESGGFTFDNNGNPVFPGAAEPEDRTLAIGFTSAIAGALFLVGLRLADRRRRLGLGTAFVLPAALAVGVGVFAIAVREGDLWFGGLLSFAAGLAVAWVANGQRRFLTWTGALAAAFGLLLVAGDSTTRIGSHATADGALHYGLLALLFGLAAVIAPIPIAVLLREPISVPAWLTRRSPPPRPPDEPTVAPLG